MKRAKSLDDLRGFNCLKYGVTVCGKLDHIVEDVSKIKCPICGSEMTVVGIQRDGKDEHYAQIYCQAHFCDSYGPHVRYYGRDHYEYHTKIMLSCPNLCIEEMTMNIKDIHVSEYKEFPEMRSY